MKRWSALLMVGVMVFATAGACGTPAPSGWQPPTLESLELSEAPVTAGTPFTVSLTVTDDKQVTRIWLRFHGPSARGPGSFSDTPLSVPCDDEPTWDPAWDPAPSVSLEIECTIPEIAPSGTWQLRVHAKDGEWSFMDERPIERIPFEVTGGSDDVQAPVAEPIEISPEPVPVGAPFTVRLRVSDEHPLDPQDLYLTYGLPNRNRKECVQTSRTLVSPTVYEWSFDCPPESVPGPAVIVQWVRDAVGYQTSVRREFDIVGS